VVGTVGWRGVVADKRGRRDRGVLEARCTMVRQAAGIRSTRLVFYTTLGQDNGRRGGSPPRPLAACFLPQTRNAIPTMAAASEDMSHRRGVALQGQDDNDRADACHLIPCSPETHAGNAETLRQPSRRLEGRPCMSQTRKPQKPRQHVWAGLRGLEEAFDDDCCFEIEEREGMAAWEG
jgi:hypothetical protein